MLPTQLRAELLEPGINPVDAKGSYWPTTGLSSQRAVRSSSSCCVALASRGDDPGGDRVPSSGTAELSEIQIWFFWHSEEELCQSMGKPEN